MKKVFHVITTINRGGAENQLLVLVQEQVKIGLEVHIIYLKGKPELKEDFVAAGATVHHKLSQKSVLMQPFLLRTVIGKVNCIVHAHLPRAELVSLLKPRTAKLIVSRHNAEPFFPGSPTLLSNLLARIVEVRSIKIIAISNAVKTYLLSRGEVKNPEKIEVVHYGYVSHFQSKLDKRSGHFALNKIGSISRLADQKDIPTMLRAFKALRQINPRATLSILGTGPLDTELKKLAQSMGIDEFVFFRGRSSMIYEFLSELDAFILTSKYEGFGMVLLEAMDSSLPIVASDNSAISEVLGSDFLGLCQTGNSSDFAAKLTALLENDYREKVILQQQNRLRLFNSSVMAQKILGLYTLDIR